MTEASDLFARDGHITMLSLDRYDVGELDDDERHCLESHVETCPHCRERLTEVASPSLTLLPPATPQHETGSVTIGYLAASAGVALAAGLVAFVGSTLMPSPRMATLTETETAGMASAYTSVAQEYSDPDAPTVDLSRDRDMLVVRSTAASIAMLRVIIPDDDGGTGGQNSTMEVVAVVPVDSHEGEAVSFRVSTSADDSELVVVACAEPITFEPGDPLDVDSGCTLVHPPLGDE